MSAADARALTDEARAYRLAEARKRVMGLVGWVDRVAVPAAAARGEHILFLYRNEHDEIAGFGDDNDDWVAFRSAMRARGYKVSRGNAAASVTWAT